MKNIDLHDVSRLNDICLSEEDFEALTMYNSKVDAAIQSVRDVCRNCILAQPIVSEFTKEKVGMNPEEEVDYYHHAIQYIDDRAVIELCWRTLSDDAKHIILYEKHTEDTGV